jgi:Zn-dependent protease with chaperone function
MNSRICNRLAVDKVLVCLLRNPYRHLVRRWNWKSACLSAFFRGILVLLANLSAGGTSAVGAMFAEICYRGLTTGFFSALMQSFRFAQPVWAASVIPMILVPLIADSCEFIMHGMRGTQRLGTTILASILFTSISTLFELFAMRHGVLVMGQTSRPLVQDLRILPKLLFEFADEARLFFLSGIAFITKGQLGGRQIKSRILSTHPDCGPVNAAAKPME